MFNKTKHIDTAFRHIRSFTIIVIVCWMLIGCFAIYKSYEMVNGLQKKIYVLVNGKAFEAYASDRIDNLLVEAKDHIKTFHKQFFTLAPDEKQIMSGIKDALYLADVTAKRTYDNLKESNYYSNIISGNVSQSIKVDSVLVNTAMRPYAFRFHGKQEITRPTNVVIRTLVTEGFLREVSRSESNPHGFLIEKWKIVENLDISTKSR